MHHNYFMYYNHLKLISPPKTFKLPNELIFECFIFIQCLPLFLGEKVGAQKYFLAEYEYEILLKN